MTREFDTVLIANRGEIACRVIRTCRALGLRTVAVASDADLRSPHALMADVCVPIGPASPLESYLRMDAVLDAARETGAGAVHPGYGFLSENAGFARACAQAGVVFLGPGPETIEAMGEKTAARRTMEAAGVPVVPGAYLPAPDAEGRVDPAAVQAAAAQVGFPMLVKAAYGGGGKGMRAVYRPEDLTAAVDAAVREAAKAFGDGLVYLERLIQRPRHVEFQIFGDAHGGAVHLGERECSIQRRHQKIVEETPSPALTPELRARMGEAAVAAARAVDYVGAGTVEFLLGDDDGFYFLEMNTRLQVEHPVTELVFGVDLVEAQIRVARGERLPWTQVELVPRGHALECRVYAEDPARGFLPSTGTLLVYEEPDGPGVRVDSGVAQGVEVTPHYDPMLAKLSVHAGDRAAAVARMRDALRRYPILGVTTNLEYLDAVLAAPAFLAGDTTTAFLDEHLADWTPASADAAVLAAAAAAEQSAAPRAAGPTGPAAAAASPWARLGRFRLEGLD
ncbi:MAG TPA: biotin carboxylase N-terminal domain-containing protein [Candidatus Krumholzibacteria bacterium]|nr:biotin carboxylase N-terminal domain-containing protein [Candidatus Krumholzibacteria bacterium]